MPLIIEKELPAYEILSKENIFLMNEARAQSQDIRPLKLAIVNLMPIKTETETQLFRMLSNSPLQIQIDLICTQTHEPQHTDMSYLHKFYHTFEEIRNYKYDGMIVTGAPIEKLPFEEVDFWQEFTQIMDFARENVYSTMFICWASEAALYYYYGVQKYTTSQKISGVFQNEIVNEHVLVRGFDKTFYAPQSRYAYNIASDLRKVPDLTIIAESEEAGVHLSASRDNRFVFVSGHVEYDADTLDREYKRDLALNQHTKMPNHYYQNDDPNQGIRQCWRSSGTLMFSNWLNYCVYQSTPFDSKLIPKKIVSKFGGSSLADSNQFEKVKRIILSEEDRNYIVVSAPGKRDSSDVKITDILARCCDLQSEKQSLLEQKQNLENRQKSMENQIELILDCIEHRFEELCEELEIEESVKQEIKRVRDEIQDTTDKDFILSRGEYLNGIIMAKYLGYRFVDAKEIIFFKKDGTLNEEKTFHAIKRTIQLGEKTVVPGFYGMGPGGNIKTFKRGGSDITGSILAHALGADVYENWTDVNGIMTEDPRFNQNASTIEEMTYEELHKIADRGAVVYHPEAIKLVEECEIPIRIKNTNHPEVKGTIIRSHEEQ